MSFRDDPRSQDVHNCMSQGDNMSKADDIRKESKAQHETAVGNIQALSDRVLGEEAARMLGGPGSGPRPSKVVKHEKSNSLHTITVAHGQDLRGKPYKTSVVVSREHYPEDQAAKTAALAHVAGNPQPNVKTVLHDSKKVWGR